MSEISGINGAVYYNKELTDTALANSIVFDAGTTGAIDQTITSSTDNGATGIIDFETRGYKADVLFSIAGATSTGNNRIFTINAVSSGALTVNEAVSTGTDTGTLVFTEIDPGREICGFYNWTINYISGVHEVTAFCNSSGGKSFIPSVTEWSATADKYFLTANNVIDDWLATEVKVRFFTRYVASPTTGSPAQYWEGDMLVTGIDETTPVDALVTQNLSFQGKGALTLTTKTNDWNTT